MDEKTAEMVQQAFKKDLDAEISLQQIEAMKSVEPNGIDDEVYALVDEKAMMFIARLLKKSNGDVDGVWVYKKSLAMIFGISKRS